MFKQGVEYGHNRFVDFIVLLSTGTMVTAYWYIPFIFLVFLASPLFDRFIAPRYPCLRVGVFLLSLVVAFWLHRPENNLNPIHAFVYFFNVYLFGILFCEYRTGLIAFARRLDVMMVLAVAIIGVALAQAMWLRDVDNLKRISAKAGCRPASISCSSRNMSACSCSAARWPDGADMPAGCWQPLPITVSDCSSSTGW